ncbi:unnamed protein product [Ilex paraguariensis]|uniref:DNA polymerase epsilon catalytic subunit n=1 Tax=Ilex paraguariensis TaxID=185542 RepID=A0ABC8SGF9_9AQUA
MNGDNRWRDRRDTRISKKQKLILNAEEQLESKLGYNLFTEGEKRLGWLLTFASSSWEDQTTHKVYSCVDLYFVCQDGSTFKAKYKFRPYFYATTKDKMEMDVDAYLRRCYEGHIADIEIVEKEDLDLDPRRIVLMLAERGDGFMSGISHKTHLSGLRKSYLKISFDTVQQLMHVKSDLMHFVERNQAKFDAAEAYESILTGKSKQRPQNFIDCIADLREYDVPYHVRFAIDNGDVRCGQWYDVCISSAGLMLERRADLLQRAEVHVCAFDIETTKLPLKFPDAEYDSVMMISYMVDGQGYLIINRQEMALTDGSSIAFGKIFNLKEISLHGILDEAMIVVQFKRVSEDLESGWCYDLRDVNAQLIKENECIITKIECVGEDIEDLEYTPKPEFEGFFKITNVKNEEELLRQWFAHMQDVKPGIYVTYNGDFFDWPFLESRAAHNGFRMSDELGFLCDKNQGECRAKFACHLDCFAWVKRDSYLPQGSQGLKAVTKAKLGYDPLEVNPEDMVCFAKERPQIASVGASIGASIGAASPLLHDRSVLLSTASIDAASISAALHCYTIDRCSSPLLHDRFGAALDCCSPLLHDRYCSPVLHSKASSFRYFYKTVGFEFSPLLHDLDCGG